MNIISTAILVILAFVGVSSTSFAQEPMTQEQRQARETLKSLNWINGPQTVNMGSNASFSIPAGYVFLNPEDTKRFMELAHNPSSGKEYMIAPQDIHWFAILEFDGTGYVKDDEKIDPTALLDSIRQGTEAANKDRLDKGWGAMTITGWKIPPYYNNDTKRLEWAISAMSDNAPVINFNTRILGRHGVTSAVLVAGPEILDNAVQQFKAALGGFEYLPGEKYTEFKQGDNVAGYGLAALIAGGAAAVATKKGFWAVIIGSLAAFWKIIVGLIVAALAGLVGFFNRKK